MSLSFDALIQNSRSSVPIRVVNTIPPVHHGMFGHSTITLTMNTYGHVLEDMKRETAKHMDTALRPVDVKSKGRLAS